MRISGRNGSKKKLGGTNMLNYSSELRKLSEESGSRSLSKHGMTTMDTIIDSYLETSHDRPVIDIKDHLFLKI